MKQKVSKHEEKDPALRELRQIKNLLMLSLLKMGATSDEVNYATGMGASNIRRLFPIGRSKKKTKSQGA